jgi:hypothetical protein
VVRRHQAGNLIARDVPELDADVLVGGWAAGRA